MNAGLRRIVGNRWFLLADLLLVGASGVGWMALPKYAIWLTLIAVFIPVVRWFGEGHPFHRAPLDALLAILLITASVGYWAAYDRTAAWIKLWLLVNAVLLYYALRAQPWQNLGALCIASFFSAVGISLYYFLTSDFAGAGGRINGWWIQNRPAVHWPAIQHGYISGLLLLASIFAFYWLWSIRAKSFGPFTIPVRLLLALATAMILATFQLAMPGGILPIGLSILGALLLWKLSDRAAWMARTRLSLWLPILVLVFLVVVVALLYLGPAGSSRADTSAAFGDDSRAQVLARAAYFLRDYPITGSGLESFPGIYSEYMLAIPYYYFADSYNLFLDVAIQQGVAGGLAFLLICVGTIGLVAWKIVNTPTPSVRLFSCLSLLALIVTVAHSMFYDYLYHGNGTFLLLFPMGMAMIGEKKLAGIADTGKLAWNPFPSWSAGSTRTAAIILVFSSLTACSFYVKKAISMWYADLGSVQMSQAELKGFPRNHWAGAEMIPSLKTAQLSLRSAIAYDPSNATANYRLGMIDMLREDFPAASNYLTSAHAQEPDHRGIIKALGYCYVWLGDLEKARSLLATIPEAKQELDVYEWWWKTQGRPDLATKAFLMVSRLQASSPQDVVSGSLP